MSSHPQYYPEYYGKLNRIPYSIMQEIYFKYFDSTEKKRFRDAHDHPVIGVIYLCPNRPILHPVIYDQIVESDYYDKYADKYDNYYEPVECEDDFGASDWWNARYKI